MFWIPRRIPTFHANQTHESVCSPFLVMVVQIVLVEFVPPLRLFARCAHVHIAVSAILRVAIERSCISRRLATRADATCGATENLVPMNLPIVQVRIREQAPLLCSLADVTCKRFAIYAILPPRREWSFRAVPNGPTVGKIWSRNKCFSKRFPPWFPHTPRPLGP